MRILVDLGETQVQALDELKREVGLRIAEIAFAIDRLAVKIGDLDHAIVDDGQLTDTGTGKRRNDGATDAAGTDDDNFRFLELALPDAAKLWQNDLPSVSVELVVGQDHCPVEPKPPMPRVVSPSWVTSRKLAFSRGAGISCAIRSPRFTANGSLPRLARITLTSPR